MNEQFMKIEYLNKVTVGKNHLGEYGVTAFTPVAVTPLKKKGCMWTVTSKYLTTAEWQIKDT